jgi:hypothetical protein
MPSSSVLGLQESSTYPTWEKSASRRAQGGWVKWYAFGCFPPAALPEPVLSGLASLKNLEKEEESDSD